MQIRGNPHTTRGVERKSIATGSCDPRCGLAAQEIHHRKSCEIGASWRRELCAGPLLVVVCAVLAAASHRPSGGGGGGTFARKIRTSQQNRKWPAKKPATFVRFRLSASCLMPSCEISRSRLAHREHVVDGERLRIRLQLFHEDDLAADEDDHLAVLNRSAVATEQPA